MPTCGFIRVQPDGMKEKDAGNRQRYDPVSKRMITIHPEIPTISKVSLSISQPVFVDPIFKSDYIVTFQGYSGCLNYGNEVTCSIYDQTGAQTATINAKITNGANVIVLNGPYTPGGYVYHATIQYGLSTFNSGTTQLIPEVSILSNTSATISNDFFNEIAQYNSNYGGFPFSFNDSFNWTGNFNLNFTSSVNSNSIQASYSIKNNQEQTLTTGNFVPTYGENSYTVSLQFITISSGSGRVSVPYNTTETFSATIRYEGTDFLIPNIVFTPALIRNVVMTFTDSYWNGSDLRVNFTMNYYLADKTLSSYANTYIQHSVRQGSPLIQVFGNDPANPIISYEQDLYGGNPGDNSYSQSITINPNTSGDIYYGVVVYDDPSFTNTVSISSSNVSLLIPEFLSSPVISQISEPYIDSQHIGTIYADFEVVFNYQPRNGNPGSLQCSVSDPLRSGTFFSQTIDAPLVGTNTVILTNIPVNPGISYTVTITPSSGFGSTSLPVICPDYPASSFLYFTDVPSTINFTIDPDLNASPFSISIYWNNIIPGSNGHVTVETIGLFDPYGGGVGDASASAAPGSSGIASITLNMSDFNVGNDIERNLYYIANAMLGFSNLRFKITDIATGIPVISQAITGIGQQ